MAVQERYFSKIQSGSGDLYRLRLYDLNHNALGSIQNATWGWQISDGVQEIETLYDSAIINWDGQNDKIHQGIIGSSFSVSFLANDSKDYGILKALKYAEEFKIGIVVERYNYTTELYEKYWVGVALPEAVRVNYSDLPIVIDMTFTDGLSLLRDVSYVDTDYSIYDGWETARSQIGKCLRHLPHLDLWGNTEAFFYEACDMFHDNLATYDVNNDIASISSVLNNIGCRQELWYEERSYSPPFFRETTVRTNGMSAYEVIENWMVGLGLRLCHAGGAFLAVSPFLKTTNRNDRLYKMDKRSMVDPAYDDSAAVPDFSNNTLLPDSVDLEVEKILAGSSMSYLHPARGVYYVHLEGGSARLFPKTKWVAVEGDFPQTDIQANLLGQIFDVSENYNVSFPLSNATAIIPTEQQLRLVGRFQHFFRIDDVPLGYRDNCIGMQFEVRMKVKVGPYYLKQNVSLLGSSNFNNQPTFGDIVKTGGDITTWSPLVISSDVEWTTTSTDRFSFPSFLVPNDVNVPSVDLLQYDAGNGVIKEYACGFGCRRHPDQPQKMQYDSTSRNLWKQAYEVILDTALPQLPTNNLEETGVEITVEVIGYTNSGVVINDTWTGTNPGGSPFTYQQVVFPTNPLRPDGARIIGFNIYIGDGTEDGDAFYYAEGSTQNGREMILGGQTMVASRVLEDYGDVGIISVNGTDGFSHEWYSESGFVYGQGKRTLEVLADEHIRQRVKTKDTFNLSFLARTEEQPWFGPHQRYKWLHESGTHYLTPFNMSHALTENILKIEGYESGRDAGTIVEHNDSASKNVGINSPGGGGGIVGTTPIFTPRSSFGSSFPGINPVDQTKLDLIDVTTSIDLDNISSGGGDTEASDLYQIFLEK